jgi:hypothetical protein
MGDDACCCVCVCVWAAAGRQRRWVGGGGLVARGRSARLEDVAFFFWPPGGGGGDETGRVRSQSQLRRPARFSFPRKGASPLLLVILYEGWYVAPAAPCGRAPRTTGSMATLIDKSGLYKTLGGRNRTGRSSILSSMRRAEEPLARGRQAAAVNVGKGTWVGVTLRRGYESADRVWGQRRNSFTL